MELPKAYDASSVEDDIYKKWEESGLFNPDNLPKRNQKGDSYCIMMPPPNRTGTLHVGHATFVTIQDILIRFHRMMGKRALWVPGTDHAAVATQVKVEQLLIKEGMKDPRRDLGREAFLERVVDFAEKSGERMIHQMKKMGASCDWSRLAYTLDEERNAAVNEMFKMMYEDGIIEKGHRLVNWDPKFETTLSDDEVITKEVTTKLLTFRYDKDFPIAISTTRPETKFGDTAVAVHPDDARYKQYIGKTIEAEFCGKPISVKIIADEAVDPEYGTGALGVTPAHSFVDAEMAERHGLPTVQVIDQSGRMMENCGEAYAGLLIDAARKKIERALKDDGLLESVEEIPQNLPIAERGGNPVEFLPMEQWFVRVNKPFKVRQKTLGKWKKGETATLKDLMRYAVESEQVRMIPDRFKKVYFSWIDNLRDWCISRQIWFGHQIPVWYKSRDARSAKHDTGKESRESSVEIHVGSEAPDEGWERDPDTLDTWFSSGTWTFSALGWPKKTKDLKTYHPTDVLETAHEIIFFWVARMILMSTYALGEVPFRDVYFHGLVRDKEGRKMSKSLDNVLDPLDLIPKYGTDAVRLSLIIGSTPGLDVRLSEQKIESYRNFTNKLWNISRYVLGVIANEEKQSAEIATLSGQAVTPRNDKKKNVTPAEAGVQSQKTLADVWILSRLADVSASVTEKLQKYQFSAAGEALRDFTWNDFADWYLEIAKIEKGKSEVLREVLSNILKLWHPFMPFVTETIWKEMGAEGVLMVEKWPELVNASAGEAGDFEKLREIVTVIRRLRADYGVPPATRVRCVIDADLEIEELIGDNLKWIEALARADVAPKEDVPEGFAMEALGSTKIGIDIAGAIDVRAEAKKIEKEAAKLQKYISATENKLQNAEFLDKAPEHVVREMSDKLGEAKETRDALSNRLKMLSSAQ
jgi:valyl-tRNA synthetase